MKEKLIETVEEAFALEGLDANNIVISGFPDRHLDAIKAFGQLCVVTDACNPDFDPDYSNYDQWKYEPVFNMPDSSGVGFSFNDCDHWAASSPAGARLVSKDLKTGAYIAKKFQDLYKKMMVYNRRVKK